MIAIISAGGRSPTEGERPTTGSDEGNPSRNELWNSYPVLSNQKGAPTKLGEVHTGYNEQFDQLESGSFLVLRRVNKIVWVFAGVVGH